jgi:ABC-type molybdenum transport system ATPase subunit/photorepair protein PhrA
MDPNLGRAQQADALGLITVYGPRQLRRRARNARDGAALHRLELLGQRALADAERCVGAVHVVDETATATVLVGANGSGKTSVLQALALPGDGWSISSSLTRSVFDSTRSAAASSCQRS